MDELELLAAKLDQLAVDPQARLSFDLFAGGLVWSDERPDWSEVVEVEGIPSIIGLGDFRALLNHRQSLILGEAGERFQELWERAKQLCPNGPGFLPSRQDRALAKEARARSAASRRSFEEVNERYELQQQQAKTSKAMA